MSYPYGTQGAPTVGGGLCGLPRRIQSDASVVSVSSPNDATANGTQILYSSQLTGAHDAYGAFNDSKSGDTPYSLWAATPPSNQFIGFDFYVPIKIKSVLIQASVYLSQSFKDVLIEGSNDKLTWDVFASATLPLPIAGSDRVSVPVQNPRKSRYWRVFVKNNHGDATYVSTQFVSFNGEA